MALYQEALQLTAFFLYRQKQDYKYLQINWHKTVKRCQALVFRLALAIKQNNTAL